jgi:hypothetical protein
MVRNKKVNKTQHKNSPKGLLTPEIIKETMELIGMLGLKNDDLATYFNVGTSTIENWAKKDPEFARAQRIGRMHYGLKVAKALNMRATGFSHEDTKIMNVNGEVQKIKYMKYYPPDSWAAQKYLSIMFRDIRADSVAIDVNHSGTINHRNIEEIPIEELSQEEQQLLLSVNMKQLLQPNQN